ncbi:universal stress protein [Candidatus Methylocalor cossyra]|uniref:Nucleotide-binding universal stress UspA family protein n=1 Tax=Candidatus Methylocalor cossyra TaxID=3108543 RepID=A0ABM9NF78_9GAMM
MPKLLVPVDDSKLSLRVIERLLAQLGWYREPPDIHLLNVRHPLHGEVGLFVGQAQISEFHREQGLKALAAARQRLDEAGVSYQFHIGVGDPAEVITRYAREQGCDQIVMGTGGHGPVTALLLGSVASKVLRLAEVPVLLIK